MNKIAWAISLCLLLATGNALAEGLSIGASYGYVDIKDSEAGFSLNATDTGYKFFGNYMFRNGLGIEGGYVDFGKPDDNFLGQVARINAEGWSLFGVGALGLSDNFDVFGKAGIVSWEADSFLDGVPVGFDDGDDLALGIGARFGGAGALGLRAEFEWFDVDEVDGLWMASVGLEFRF